jgi:hypothetical protein
MIEGNYPRLLNRISESPRGVAYEPMSYQLTVSLIVL